MLINTISLVIQEASGFPFHPTLNHITILSPVLLLNDDGRVPRWPGNGYVHGNG